MSKVTLNVVLERDLTIILRQLNDVIIFTIYKSEKLILWNNFEKK